MHAVRSGSCIAWEDPERDESIIQPANVRAKQLMVCLSSLPAKSVICLVLTRSKDFLSLISGVHTKQSGSGTDRRRHPQDQRSNQITKTRLVISTSDLATACIEQANIDNYIELPSEYEFNPIVYDVRDTHIEAIQENNDLSRPPAF
jgi:hypothetical protein